MNRKFTQEEVFRDKLTGASIPDWKEGWNQMEPVLKEMEQVAYTRRLYWGKRLSVAAVALLTGLTTWWLTARPPVKEVRQVYTAVNTLPEKMTEEKLRTGMQEDMASGISTPAPPPASFKASVAGNAVDDKHTGIQPGRVLHHVNSSMLPVLTGRVSASCFSPVQPGPPASPGPGHIFCRQDPADEKLPAPAAQRGPVAGGEEEGSKIHFALRLNANGASSFGHPSANFSPVLKGTPLDVYPSVYVGKSIGSKLSLQAGLAIASPVNVQREGLNRSVSDPLRAMAANVQQSHDSINLNRLYYADIPVTLHYHLGKNFSIGSGLQVSVLEKVIGEKQRLDYDRYGMVTMALPQQPQPENLTHAKTASGTISPVDVRWVIGLQYQLGKHWNASLQYQYGLTDISRNEAFLNNHVNRNNFLRAGLGFVIR